MDFQLGETAEKPETEYSLAENQKRSIDQSFPASNKVLHHTSAKCDKVNLACESVTVQERNEIIAPQDPQLLVNVILIIVFCCC